MRHAPNCWYGYYCTTLPISIQIVIRMLSIIGARHGNDCRNENNMHRMTWDSVKSIIGILAVTKRWPPNAERSLTVPAVVDAVCIHTVPLPSTKTITKSNAGCEMKLAWSKRTHTRTYTVLQRTACACSDLQLYSGFALKSALKQTEKMSQQTVHSETFVYSFN